MCVYFLILFIPTLVNEREILEVSYKVTGYPRTAATTGHPVISQVFEHTSYNNWLFSWVSSSQEVWSFAVMFRHATEVAFVCYTFAFRRKINE